MADSTIDETIALTAAGDDADPRVGLRTAPAAMEKKEPDLELNELMGTEWSPSPPRFPPECSEADLVRFDKVAVDAESAIINGHPPPSKEVYPMSELNFTGDEAPACPSCTGSNAEGGRFKMDFLHNSDSSRALAWVFLGRVVVRRVARAYICHNRGHLNGVRRLFYPQGFDFLLRTGLFSAGHHHFFSLLLL